MKSIEQLLRWYSGQQRETLKRRLSVNVPDPCTVHECVKYAYDAGNEARRCIVCQHYHKSIECDTCLNCLASEHLDNFKVLPEIAAESWYQYMVKEAEGNSGQSGGAA